MNTPNPLVPQGTFAESATKSRTRAVVFTILAAHVVFVGALLLQSGCKRTTPEPIAPEPTNEFGVPETFTPPPPPPPVEVYTPPTNAVSVYTPPTNIYVPPTNEIIPPPPPEPPAQLAGALKEHKIVRGDTFVSLGKKYGVGWKAIVEANPGVDPTRLRPGMTIKIPEPKAKEPAPSGVGVAPAGESQTMYTVQSGDNLTKIARKYGTTPKALRSANNLRTDRIKVGDRLKIPGNAGATTETRNPGGTE